MTSKRLACQLDGRGVELANDVVLRGDDVEVEPPVDVVMVYLANARVSIAENPKRGRMVPVHAPPADVPVPARLQLADHVNLLPLAVYGHAPKVPRIRPGVEDGPRGCWALTNPRGDVRPEGLRSCSLIAGPKS